MTRRRRKNTSSFDIGRVLAPVMIGVGALALILSIYNPMTAATEQQGFSVDQLPELEEQAQPSELKAATRSTTDLAPPPGGDNSSTAQPERVRSALREAVPIEALPATNVKSISGGNPSRSSSSSASSTSATYTGPLSVSLVAVDDDLAEDLADRVAAQLRASNRDVKLTSLETAGRPEVLVVMNASGASTQAWYCDPGPSGNASLAQGLLSKLPSSSTAETSPGTDLRELFSCADVHAGRAQTAAVLLELPSMPAASEEEAAKAVAAAINRYLDENATALRRSRGGMSLSWPAKAPITSYFGPAHPLGIDIGLFEGNIVAAVDGKVVFAGGDACCSYGLYVVIESPGGIHTLYAHLNRISVKAGQAVKQGQVLGPVGCTGRCDGNHLHFEVFRNGIRVDPMLYLP